MIEKIIAALHGLDSDNVNHWTADGQPRLDTVRMLAADQGVQRSDVEAVAPGYTRTNRVIAETTAQVDAPVQQTTQAANGGPPTGTVGDDSKSLAPAPVTPPQAKQPQVDNAETKTQDDSGALSLEQQLAQAQEASAAARQKLNEAQKAWDAARKEEDRLLSMANRAVPADNPSESIQAYLKSQRQSLQDRADRKKLIAESGLNLKELARNLKAPIDASRERKLGR